MQPRRYPPLDSPNAIKQQQLLFTLVRQLGEAQFVQADQQRASRLWAEVDALEIDPERVTRLLYGGHDFSDRIALDAIDRHWVMEQSVIDPDPGSQPRIWRFWSGRIAKRAASSLKQQLVDAA